MKDLKDKTVEELMKKVDLFSKDSFDELARRLEEAQAEIKTLRNVCVTQQEEIEADDRNVSNLMDQVHAMSQEIERMQPVVEAAIGLRHDDYMDVPTYFERAVDEYEKPKP